MEITLNVFFWEIVNAPLVLVLICCVIIGYLLAVFYFIPRVWKLKKELNQLTKFNDELKEYRELHQKRKIIEGDKITDPEGMEFDDDDGENENGFFKD
jgi:hypothetical protein